jgi:hypothetical protein
VGVDSRERSNAGRYLNVRYDAEVGAESVLALSIDISISRNSRGYASR